MGFKAIVAQHWHFFKTLWVKQRRSRAISIENYLMRAINESYFQRTMTSSWWRFIASEENQMNHKNTASTFLLCLLRILAHTCTQAHSHTPYSAVLTHTHLTFINTTRHTHALALSCTLFHSLSLSLSLKSLGGQRQKPFCFLMTEP